MMGYSLPKHCHWVKDPQFEGGEFMVPMCMGGAVYGMEGCTCDTPKSRYEEIEARADRAEKQVLDLLKTNAGLRRLLVQMQISNHDLRRKIAGYAVVKIGGPQ